VLVCLICSSDCWALPGPWLANLNRLTSRQFNDGTTPLRFDEEYTARDQVGTITRYSDLAGTTRVGESLYTYDDAGRLENLKDKDGSGNLLANYTYTYDLASRVTSEVLNGSPTTFAYDDTNQLTDDSVNSYTYDLNGNRETAGGQAYQTGTSNRLETDGVYTYTYDVEGNLTKKSKGASDETWVYSYDERNQLIGVEKQQTDGGTLLTRATYMYDVYGNRVEKQVWTSASGTTTTRFALDGWKNPVDGSSQPYALKGNENFDVWAELDGSNQLTMRRLFGDEVDQLAARISAGGTAAWYLTDWLGSVKNLTNGSGTLIGTLVYDGYGNVTTDTSGANGDQYQWTGRERDAETGLQYNRARYYDPITGRWLNEDPWRFRAGNNLYRYVTNDPSNHSDPSGLRDLTLAEIYERDAAQYQLDTNYTDQQLNHEDDAYQQYLSYVKIRRHNALTLVQTATTQEQKNQASKAIGFYVDSFINLKIKGGARAAGERGQAYYEAKIDVIDLHAANDALTAYDIAVGAAKDQSFHANELLKLAKEYDDESAQLKKLAKAATAIGLTKEAQNLEDQATALELTKDFAIDTAIEGVVDDYIWFVRQARNLYGPARDLYRLLYSL
jgi:RHS repeat-associated protein